MELLIHAPASLAPRTLRFDPPLSEDELFRFCQLNDVFRIELTREGVIEMNAPAGFETGGGNSEITAQLHTWWRTHRRGRVFDSNTGWTLPDGSMLSPDASYLSAEALARVPQSERDRFAHVCPEFIIELMSKTDRLTAAKKKITRWMENGVKLGWLVQPKRERVFVYAAGQPEPIEVTGSQVEGSGPVEGFCLNLDEVWEHYL